MFGLSLFVLHMQHKVIRQPTLCIKNPLITEWEIAMKKLLSIYEQQIKVTLFSVQEKICFMRTYLLLSQKKICLFCSGLV